MGMCPWFLILLSYEGYNHIQQVYRDFLFYMCTSWWSSYLDKPTCVVPLKQTWEWGRHMLVAELLQRRCHPGCWCNLADQRSLAQEPPGQHWRYTPGLPQMWSRLGQKSSPFLFGMPELSPQSGAVPGRQIWGCHSSNHHLHGQNMPRQSTVDECPASMLIGKRAFNCNWILYIVCMKLQYCCLGDISTIDLSPCSF